MPPQQQNSSDQDDEQRPTSRCIHPLVVLGNRLVLRVLSVVYHLICFACLISLMTRTSATLEKTPETQPYHDSLASPTIYLYLFTNIFGGVMGLIWLCFYASFRTFRSPITIVCSGASVNTCKVVNWEIMADILIGCLIGGTSITMIKQSPCSGADIKETFGTWCPLFNVGIAFGIFGMLNYGFIVMQDFRACCGREPELVSTTPSRSRVRLEPTPPASASKSPSLSNSSSQPPINRADVWPPPQSSNVSDKAPSNSGSANSLNKKSAWPPSS